MFISNFPSDPIGIIAVIIAFILLGAVLVFPVIGTVSSVIIFTTIIINWDSLVADEMLFCLFITLVIIIGIDVILIAWNIYNALHVTSLLLPTFLIAWLLWKEPFVELVIVVVVLALAVIIAKQKKYPLLKVFKAKNNTKIEN